MPLLANIGNLKLVKESTFENTVHNDDEPNEKQDGKQCQPNVTAQYMMVCALKFKMRRQN